MEVEPSWLWAWISMTKCASSSCARLSGHGARALIDADADLRVSVVVAGRAGPSELRRERDVVARCHEEIVQGARGAPGLVLDVQAVGSQSRDVEPRNRWMSLLAPLPRTGA